MELDPQDPTYGEAVKALAQQEAELDQADKATTQAASATTEAPARATGEEKDQSQSPKTDSVVKDGAAAAEEPKTEKTTEKQPEKSAEPDDKAKSKYAQSQERRDKSWKALNEEKAAFTKQQEQLKADRDALVIERKKLEGERQKLSQPKHTPEEVEFTAKAWEREAEALEAQGKYEEADEKRLLAKQAKAWAGELRANPPKPSQTDQEAQAEYDKLQKQWWSKAVIDFPALGKEASPEAVMLKGLVEANPHILKDPEGLYWAGRLAVAETSAATVPKMEKELGELRAKVKDLNEKLAVSGDSIQLAGGLGKAKSPSEMSDEELEASIRSDIEAREPHY
jgi:hypothetical protein